MGVEEVKVAPICIAFAVCKDFLTVQVFMWPLSTTLGVGAEEEETELKVNDLLRGRSGFTALLWNHRQVIWLLYCQLPPLYNVGVRLADLKQSFHLAHPSAHLIQYLGSSQLANHFQWTLTPYKHPFWARTPISEGSSPLFSLLLGALRHPLTNTGSSWDSPFWPFMLAEGTGNSELLSLGWPVQRTGSPSLCWGCPWQRQHSILECRMDFSAGIRF